MARGLSLRTKSALFLIGFALVLEGSILAWLFYSGRDSIERRSRREALAQAVLVKSAMERALADAETELTGLRAQLLLYAAPLRASDAALRPLEDIVVAAPEKWAGITYFSRPARRAFTARAVSEFRRVYPVLESRPSEEPAPECAGAPCVLDPPAGSREGLLRIAAPVAGRGWLAAELHLSFVLESMRREGSAPDISLLATDRHGLIRYASDVSLLRTYLHNSAPELAFLPAAPGEGGALRLRDEAVRWERIRQPDLLLVVRKDEKPELRELRLRLYSAALFTAAMTLLAFLGVWALTGRMASSLRHVAQVANSVAAGDFSRRIDIRRGDELGLLIDSFNGMTARLETSYQALNEVNLELQRKISELTRTRRRLSEKQRLAVIGEAISKISHEILNKIGAAGVWVQNLECYGGRDENIDLCVREMKAALASFLEMLVHFKRFYRAPPLAKERILAADLIRRGLARTGAELRARQLRVCEELGEDAAWLEVDPGQMTDAIVNILLNAAHFSPDRGVLRIGLRRENAHLVLSFQDQGPGLPPKARLFQPFYTTRPTGSGLGLAIVRNIVRAHSGRVRAYNCPEGGACFEIQLPAPQGESA
ncbi:MAG: sensor histidine kinase [Acidobacteria bacterium]|nr:sensor histidine kinase [Acidobacteriota bacterium]